MQIEPHLSVQEVGSDPQITESVGTQGNNVVEGGISTGM